MLYCGSFQIKSVSQKMPTQARDVDLEEFEPLSLGLQIFGDKMSRHFHFSPNSARCTIMQALSLPLCKHTHNHIFVRCSILCWLCVKPQRIAIACNALRGRSKRQADSVKGFCEVALRTTLPTVRYCRSSNTNSTGSIRRHI